MAKGESKLENEIVKDKKAELTTLSYETVGYTGYEDVTAKDLLIPFLVLLQKGSPQVDEANSACIKDAKAGQFYNTATKEVVSELNVIPVKFASAIVEWRPNRGGFIGTHKHTDEIWVNATKTENDNGKVVFLSEKGNELVDTMYMHVLVKTKTGLEPGLMVFTSSQLKKCREWLTKAQRQLITGTTRPYPLFAFDYRVSKLAESKDSYTWWGYSILKLSEEPLQDETIFNAALAYIEQLNRGILKFNHDDSQTNAEAIDHAAF